MKKNRPNRRHFAIPRGIALALAASMLYSTVAASVPTSQLALKEVKVPFAPPLGEILTYRSQEVVEQNGVKRTRTTVETYRFEVDGDGFRLNVTPKSTEDDNDRPMMKAIAAELGDLMMRPYAFRVTDDGELGELINQDFYWNAIFDAVAKTKPTSSAAKPLDPKIKAMLDNFIKSLREMPTEARTALMAEGTKPLFEFAGTAFALGSTVRTKLEAPSPYGGRVARDVSVSLDRVDGDIARFKVTSTIPRAELEAIVKAMVSKLDKDVAAKLGPKIAEMSQFSSDSTSEYAVSLNDGMLEDFRSVETIVSASEGKTSRKVTIKTLTRVR